jgi:hypothetical protein
MQRIYSYIPETNHISRVYNVAAVLCLYEGYPDKFRWAIKKKQEYITNHLM